MTMRVLLVSLVASLGLALPSGERLDSWVHSARAWLGTRLSEWSTNQRALEDVVVVAADPAAVAPTPKRAEERTPTPAPAPIALTAPEVQESVARLNVPTWRAVKDWWAKVVAPAFRKAEGPEALAGAYDLQWELESWDGEAVDVAEQTAALPSWLSTRLAEAVVDERDFVVTPEAVLVAAQPASAPVAEADPDRAFREVVDAMAAEFARDLASAPALAANPEPVAKVPAFEPLEVGEDLYPGLAYALNREAEVARVHEPVVPPALEAPAPAADAPARADNRLARALRLTREAVNAWASLLHGPALVTIDR